MKKGNGAPRTRVRWQSNHQPAGGQNCPTWLKISSLSLSYFDALHLPATLAVIGLDCTPGRWGYSPHDGMVIYKGDWDNGHNLGHWQWGIRPSADTVAFCYFEIYFDEGAGPNGYFRFTNGGVDVNRLFSPVQDMPLYNLNIIQQDFPWVLSVQGECRWMTYAEIRAMGEDPDDTSPRSWTDSL